MGKASSACSTTEAPRSTSRRHQRKGGDRAQPTSSSSSKVTRCSSTEAQAKHQAFTTTEIAKASSLCPGHNE
eukprot:4635210-Prorocentrum_lima.AAC.1